MSRWEKALGPPCCDGGAGTRGERDAKESTRSPSASDPALLVDCFSNLFHFDFLEVVEAASFVCELMELTDWKMGSGIGRRAAYAQSN